MNPEMDRTNLADEFQPQMNTDVHGWKNKLFTEISSGVYPCESVFIRG